MARERRPAAVLELAILGLLKDQELHGYELKKRLSERLGFTSGVSFGSLYPALARLEAAGEVKAVDAVAATRHIPLTGSLGGELAAFRARSVVARGGRGKKVYGITDQGERRFEQLLATEQLPGDDDRLFSLRLGFARFLPVDVRLRLLERRRSQLLDRLASAARRAGVETGRLDSYSRTVAEHDREVTQREISWIERLIDDERAGRSPAPVPAASSPARASSQPPSSDGSPPVAGRPVTSSTKPTEVQDQ